MPDDNFQWARMVPVKTTRYAVNIVAFVAGMLCLLVYLRALSCGFVNWEDQDYVLNNVVIRSLDWNMLASAFTTTPVSGFWLPLTYISFAVDYHFWGLNPFGYHLTNILLHAVSTGLIVLLADALYRARFAVGEVFSTKNYLYFGMLLISGLLFGIHPARVESVTWVTERKDVLNGVFLLGSILYYLYYQQKKDGDEKVIANKYYFISLLLFLLSLWAKPSSVVLPVLLLVLDCYPLSRMRQGKILMVILEKVPYLLLSVLITAVTVMLTMKFDTFVPFNSFPLDQRVIASGNSFFEYFKLMVYPVGIVPHYPLPKILPYSYIIKGLVVLFAFCGCFYWRKKAPWLIPLILFFVIPILPVSQLLACGTVQVILLCRYTYIPSMIPSIITSVLIVTSYQKIAKKPRSFAGFSFVVVTIIMLLFYAVMTQRLIGVWKDSGTMWSRVIDFYPFDRAYFFRGLYYVDSTKNYTAAVADYTKFIDMATTENFPEIYNVYAFRGEALAKAGRYAEAIKDFNKAISLFPHGLFYYHRGMSFKALGRAKESEDDLLKAGSHNGQMHWF